MRPPRHDQMTRLARRWPRCPPRTSCRGLVLYAFGLHFADVLLAISVAISESREWCWRRPPPVTLALRGIVEAKWRPPLRETDPFILPSLLTGPGLLQRERPRWPRPRWRATSVQPLFQSACKTERSKFNIVRRPLLAGPFLVFSQKSRFHFHFSPTYAHTRTHLCVN